MRSIYSRKDLGYPGKMPARHTAARGSGRFVCQQAINSLEVSVWAGDQTGGYNELWCFDKGLPSAVTQATTNLHTRANKHSSEAIASRGQGNLPCGQVEKRVPDLVFSFVLTNSEDSYQCLVHT